MHLNPHIILLANMDETRIELDMVKDQTIDLKRQKYINIETTNSENKAFAIALCAFNNGRKLPPYIIMNSKSTILRNRLDELDTIYNI